MQKVQSSFKFALEMISLPSICFQPIFDNFIKIDQVYCCLAFSARYKNSKDTEIEMKKKTAFLIESIQLIQQTCGYHVPGTMLGARRNPGRSGLR